jgi:sulfur relay (sulfurtransferase) DsrC/TusE family protein
MNDDWTPKLAEELAEAVGIALGEKHWRVIAESRELIARHGRAPSLAEVSAICGVALAELRQLFPGGAEEVLARLAGAPELEKRRQAS